MTGLEKLLDEYPGTHVAWFGDVPSWSLTGVNFDKCTAYVVNGHWVLKWDDADLYYQYNGFLEWMCERPADWQIQEIPDSEMSRIRKRTEDLLAEIEEWRNGRNG